MTFHLLRRLFCLLLALTLLSAGAASVTPQLAGGADHSLALRSDGQVFAWGDDGSGQLGSARLLFRNTPQRVAWPDAANVTQLAAGAYHSLALMRDGSLLSWGNNAYGELGDGSLTSHGVPLKVAGLPAIAAAAAGEQHSVAAARDGQVWAWGSNEDGRLGSGSVDAERSLVPLPVVDLTDVVDVRAGKAHSLALTRAGVVLAWGSNVRGQLGDSTGTRRSRPVPVDFPTPAPKIVAIDAAGDQSFAQDDQGRLWTWGENQYHQLGESVYDFRTYPLYLTALAAAGPVRNFAVGPAGGAAVLGDGSVWVWGFYGRYPEPTRVTSLPGAAAQVRLGEGHLLVALGDGRLLATGDNQLGQLGDGSASSSGELVFVSPQGVANGVVALAAGYYHSLLRDGSGGFWAWGDNSRGQLGDGVETTLTVPRAVAGLGLVKQIAAGSRHTLVLQQDGSVWAWGDNDEGNLGHGRDDVRISTAPVRASGLAGVQQVAAGGSSSAAIDGSGQLWTWGANLRGQLAIDETVFRSNVPGRALGLPALGAVAVGNEHMLGLDRAGAVWIWGSNGYGQLGDGYDQRSAPRQLTSLSNVVALAAAGDHSLALDRQGRVWAWGDNGYNQSSPAPETQIKVPVLVSGLPGNIKAIAAGYWSSFALDGDGNIWAWGSGNEGQLGNGVQDISAAPVRADGSGFGLLAAGAAHTLAMRSDGVVWSFGLNYSGQLGNGLFLNQSRYGAVVDAGLADFFDLLPEQANLALPEGKRPPFLLQTQKVGSDRLLTLRTRIRLDGSAVAALRAASRYDVYVAAIAPGQTTSIWLRQANVGWAPYLSGPLAAYLRNVSAGNDSSLLIDILENTDLSSLPGTQFYVGYGSSSDEMLTSGRVRLMYQVSPSR